MSKRNTFLVTGGAGFIGSHIAERLVLDGEKVCVLDNLKEGKIENLSRVRGKINFIKGDIRREKDLERALQGVDYVLHQAALRSVPKSMDNPIEYDDVNASGTLKLLMKAREHGVKRLVFASSSSIYGERSSFPEKESDTPQPVSPYAVTKLIGEHYCRLFSGASWLETVSLRYFNVFGPRQSLENQYAVVIPRIIISILNDESPPVHWDGRQERDFTYIDNVVEANIRAARAKGVSGEVINVACGKCVSILNLVNEVNRILVKDVRPAREPKRAGDVRKTLASIVKLKKKLGIKSFIHFREGLELTVRWFKENSCA